MIAQFGLELSENFFGAGDLQKSVTARFISNKRGKEVSSLNEKYIKLGRRSGQRGQCKQLHKQKLKYDTKFEINIKTLTTYNLTYRQLA